MLRCGQMMMAEALVRLHLSRGSCATFTVIAIVLNLIDGFATEWRWSRGKNDPNYYKILRLFMDKRDLKTVYSIHQIGCNFPHTHSVCYLLCGSFGKLHVSVSANMGASDGKPIGQWFGPNTIAQALKSVAAFAHFTQVIE